MTDVSKFLPMSLGSLFSQPQAVAPIAKTVPPLTIPGAFNAPELCLLVDTWRTDLAPADPYMEVKLDGLRCLTAAGQQFTREGSPMECASHTLPILREIERVFGEPMFFDGEYVNEAGVEAALSDFRARRCAGTLWLFDAVPFTEWRGGQASRQPLVERKRRLRRALEEVGIVTVNPNQPVGFIEGMPVRPQDVERHVRDLWALGYEGGVIKGGGSRYYRKRVADWMKVKQCAVSPMVLVDVLGVKRGGQETAGSVVVRLEGQPPSKPCRIPVHGATAATLWAERSARIGQKVMVRHAGFTGGGQPREAQVDSI